jgi:hypothetical protein
MSTSAAATTLPRPPLAGATQGMLRWISCSNPFYVISAALFLVGLWASFEAQADEVQTWTLMGGLAGYTLLLALTAFLLVRFARDWEDLRTVLLLVVLMFLATSVTFDEVLIVSPARGVACYLIGLAFTILVSEGVLRGIGLRMPMAFRIPYYLILSLFFLYPLALSPLVHEPHSEALLWGLFGFSSVAGLVFLTLLPAIRRGNSYVKDNGSPWGWPLYPWVLFGLLGLAVPARAFLLCWSMHLLPAGQYDRVIFGPYFLIPFGFAFAVLLLEIGLVSASRGVIAAALTTPVGLAALAVVGHRDDAIYQECLTLVTARAGASLLHLAVVAAFVFYAYAAFRRVRLSAALALLIVTAWLVRTAWGGYQQLRQAVTGMDQIVLSMALFALALLISLGKAGLLARLLVAWGWAGPAAPGPSENKENAAAD